MLRIESVSAPGHAAQIPGDHERAVQTGRSKNAVIAQLLDHIAASLAVLWRWPPSFVGGEGLAGQRRRFRRDGLRGPGVFAGDITLGHGSFFNREDRLAAVPLQHVKQPRLIALNHDRNVLSAEAQGSQQGWWCAIEIPEVMMNELESPYK